MGCLLSQLSRFAPAYFFQRFPTPMQTLDSEFFPSRIKAMKKTLRDNWDNWDNCFYAPNSPKSGVKKVSWLVYIVNNQLVR